VSERGAEREGGVTARALTPPAGAGAIAVVQLRAHGSEDLGGYLTRVGLPRANRRPVLGDLLGVDEGLVIRWDDSAVDLFCHGGPAVVRRLLARLAEGGAVVDPSAEPFYPEAEDDLERRMLATLARAPSPLAVDLLLAQPGRWRASPRRPGSALDGGDARDRTLRRLVDPPLVAAVGPANVGKSTLLNRLAGRSVAIVADEPGTTRDHVGAVLDLGGLVVRYLDTPGLLGDAAGVDAEAIGLARRAWSSADLLLLCGDPAREPGLPEFDGAPGGVPPMPVIRVCLRSDLAPDQSRPDAGWSARADVAISAATGGGIAEFTDSVRDRLVPPADLADPRPWRFWEA
jgi:tRNA U34 5-carboxymethylaminomethyl modifying GTPase MnmE/TrmE